MAGREPSVMNIIQLNTAKNKDTIHALRVLLEQAEAGQIDGLMFCVKQPGKQHALGLTGLYADDPAQAIGAAARLQHRLNLLADQTEAEPARYAR